MQFLTGTPLQAAIRKILAEKGCCCAVAFWGAGSEEWLTGPEAKIICNLRSGGTNPFALRNMKGVSIKQCDDLHAKVYIGQDRVIITSANASANGLGLENSEQAGWIEAGTYLSDTDVAQAWFDDFWELRSRPISNADWLKAESDWTSRQRSKPTLGSFAEFNVLQTQLPLMAWSIARDWEQCEEEVTQQLGFCNEESQRRIDNGMEFEAEEDIEVLKGQWILGWERGKIGGPAVRKKPWWIQLSNVVVNNAFVYLGEDKPRSIVIGVENRDPPPFDPTEPLFVESLREVVNRDEYFELRTTNYEGAWFAARVPLMQQCWHDVKALYDAKRDL